MAHSALSIALTTCLASEVSLALSMALLPAYRQASHSVSKLSSRSIVGASIPASCSGVFTSRKLCAAAGGRRSLAARKLLIASSVQAGQSSSLAGSLANFARHTFAAFWALIASGFAACFLFQVTVPRQSRYIPGQAANKVSFHGVLTQDTRP